jgi:type III restriction enzyme
MMTLREYQQKALDILSEYYRSCVELSDANVAFYQCCLHVFGKGIGYQPVPGLSGLPYVCIRIPTGGGKTFVACHAVSVTTRELLQADRSLVLWLVPSNAILEQTITALKDINHPYRHAIERELGSITVLSTSEALSVSRSVLDTSTTIIVSTIQAFRVEDTEGRKVYEPSGSLMEHFGGHSIESMSDIETYENGKPISSFANVLRLRRPIVVVDEAHNARTELSFSTLANLNPSCIIEFTATPDTEKNPSNVLYSVSAAQLKAEDMIKMPILLETRPNWKELLADAINKLNELEAFAHDEQKKTGEYLRPIMLIQAQPKKGESPITVDVIEECLLKEFKIPEDQVARATGTDRGLEGVDILSEECPIRFVITIQALREGWDCPFAYVLCSLAEMRSKTAVEQILGRVMRLPNIQRKGISDLNNAYAFVASNDFAGVATRLVDGLVDNGFEKFEAETMVSRPYATQQSFKGTGFPLFNHQEKTVEIELGKKLRLEDFSELEGKVTVDDGTSVIKLLEPLEGSELRKLNAIIENVSDMDLIRNANNSLRGISEALSPSQRGEKFEIPVLAYKRNGQSLIPFEETHIVRMLNLSNFDTTLSEQEFSSEPPPTKVAKIDIEEEKLKLEFITRLHQRARLLSSDQGWSQSELVYWLDNSIPNRQDILPEESGLFLTDIVAKLISERGLSIEYLIKYKYRLKRAVNQKIVIYRRSARDETYQQLLDIDTSPLVVSPACCFLYDPLRYPYNQRYEGKYSFKKHYYDKVGAFDNSEEEECAWFIDCLPEVKYWVRNPSRSSKSFWLQTATDKFYPDFVCMLTDERFLVVEYKGADRWTTADSEEKRIIGDLYELRSNGMCLFIMPKGKDLSSIESKVRNSN